MKKTTPISLALLCILLYQPVYALEDAMISNQIAMMDEELVKEGIVDKNYKVIDQYGFNKSLATANLEVQIGISQNKFPFPKDMRMDLQLLPAGIFVKYTAPMELPDNLEPVKIEAMRENFEYMICQYLGVSKVLTKLNWKVNMEFYDKQKVLKLKHDFNLGACSKFDGIITPDDSTVTDDKKERVEPKKSLQH